MKPEVYEFATEVINDMDRVAVAFGDGMAAFNPATKMLLSATWKDLQKKRYRQCKFSLVSESS